MSVFFAFPNRTRQPFLLHTCTNTYQDNIHFCCPVSSFMQNISLSYHILILRPIPIFVAKSDDKIRIHENFTSEIFYW